MLHAAKRPDSYRIACRQRDAGVKSNGSRQKIKWQEDEIGPLETFGLPD
jgi:hypothetical protein